MLEGGRGVAADNLEYICFRYNKTTFFQIQTGDEIARDLAALSGLISDQKDE